MTGYGKAEQIYKTKRIVVEVKTLNSKQLDLSLKLPQELRPQELDYRNEVANILQRGKIDVSINVTDTNVEQNTHIEKEVIASYLKQIKEISEEYNIPASADMAMLLFKMPGIFVTPEQEYDETFIEKVKETLLEALKITDEFRRQEGEVLKTDLLKRKNLILEYLGEVDPFETGRHENIKNKLIKNLTELTQSGKYDENRFEQELIFYLEKLDITEEKVRLAKHCSYFDETIDEEGAGKKLGFISQEMGREINTLGSKANDADIQRLVVKMKDELEKIKEQLFNIL
ncbi:MAG: YicC family protein [Bacteroidales bacterium]|nr:YicC family protein [Bacteroidales bacterium]MBR5781746.1 YicC family protein [Bacteroidales bacterium]